MHITAKQNIIKPAEKISYENLSASLQPPTTEMFCDFQTVSEGVTFPVLSVWVPTSVEDKSST